MKLGEFIINIATKGDTKELDKALKKLEKAEKQTRRQIELKKRLAEATSEEEKALIKKNFEQQEEIDKLKEVKDGQVDVNNSFKKGISTTLKWIGAISLAVTTLDRMGNSLLKANQLYLNFSSQTGMSISRLNRMAGIAQLSGMNLSPEQVASDLTNLQQRIFNLGLTGQGSGIFAQLGINPLGMKSDEFIATLRQRTKNLSGEAKTYILDQLGLSREWINILNLQDAEFAEHIRQTKALQLTEEERLNLAKQTRKQQVNNMRWELAKQKFLISVMPAVQKVMDIASQIALYISESLGSDDVLDKLRNWGFLLTGVLLSVNKIKDAFISIAGVLGLGGLLGGKFLAKQGGKLALAGATSKAGTAGLIISGLLILSSILDAVNYFKEKEEKKDNIAPPIDTQATYTYRNNNSNMVNNFYNNPQPASEIARELDYWNSRFLSETRK